MASQPGKWDYTLAGVPSPLTDELESQQLAKQVGCSNLTSPIVAFLTSSYPLPHGCAPSAQRDLVLGIKSHHAMQPDLSRAPVL